MTMLANKTSPITSLLVAVLLILNTGNVVSAADPRKSGGRSQLKRMSFFEQLSTGDTVELLEHGPFTITARCIDDYHAAALFATVTAEDEDEWVFGSPDYDLRSDGDDDAMCIGLHPAGTSAYCQIWVSGAGTWRPAAFESLSGYYVGVVGHTIGFDIGAMSYPDAHFYHGYGEDDLAAFPSDQYKCMIAGVLEYFD